MVTELVLDEAATSSCCQTGTSMREYVRFATNEGVQYQVWAVPIVLPAFNTLLASQSHASA